MDKIAERLAALERFGPLGEGSHEDRKGICIMEAVAFVAGEPWSDAPECACPVISTFLRSWNDALPDEERDTLLRSLIPRIVGTRSNAEVERRRSLMAADWLIREHTPAWLRLATLDAAANALAGLPEITEMAQFPSIRGPIEAAQRDAAAAWAAARDAAWAAAWDAARTAAWDAARAAARDAAWDAAARDAAWDAARDAAWAAAARAAAWAAARTAARTAAWDAAWDAARDAAWAALSATRRELQQSALRLVERMIACDEALAARERRTG